MNKQIFRLAIPNMISNITVPLVGLMDLAMLGHKGNEIHIGAIGLASIIFNYVYIGFGFLRMGTSGFTAQAYGAEDQKESFHIFSRAMSIALLGSILVLLLQYPIEWTGFQFLDASDQVTQFAREYYQIRIWAAPATIGLYALTGWFTGMQNALIPMLLAMVINGVNIIANYIFIYHFNWYSSGVAIGTVIAQYCGLFLGLSLFIIKHRKLVRYWNRKTIFKAQKLRAFMSLNGDILVRTITLITAFSVFTAQSAKINDTILAVNQILIQFLFIYSYFIDGIAYAAEALTGKAIGAKNLNELKQSVKALFKWGIYITVPFSFIYIVGGEKILYLITNQQNIINSALEFIPWIYLIPITSFAAFIWDGIYIGATAGKTMRNIMLICTLIIFLPAQYFLLKSYGNHGLWFAMLLFMGARSVFFRFYYKRSILQQVQ